LLAVLALPFEARRRLEAENAVLRHQLIVLRRKVRGRPLVSGGAAPIVSIDSAGSYGHATGDVGPVAGWLSQLLALGKSGSRGGRPRIDSDLRALIKKMNLENPLWGAPQ
jgi:hypothetical protein